MSLAQKLDPVAQIGRSGITPELTESVAETFNTRELVKINIQKSCAEDGRTMAEMLAERTHSQPVQVIGRKIVLYKPAKRPEDRKIELPR